MTDLTPPHDLDAEESLLGAMLLNPGAIAAASECGPADFYRPSHGHVFGAIVALYRRGEPADPVTVADELRRTGLLETIGGPSALTSLQVAAPSSKPANAAGYARIIQAHAESRGLQQQAHEILDAIAHGKEPEAVREALLAGVADSRRTAGTRVATRTIDEIAENATLERRPWVVPDLFKERWRTIITAREGGSKSVVLRQLASCAAQGVHPWTFARFQPAVSLVIDLENEDEAIAETGSQLARQLRSVCGDRYVADRLQFLTLPEGIDIRSRYGRSTIEGVIGDLRPQLVCMGPVYKMSSRKAGEDYEHEAKEVQSILDDWRVRFNFALVLETHSPQGPNDQQRELRPYGSTYWRRWPEFGIGLKPIEGTPDLAVTYFRGSRMKVSWPQRLARSNGWPFTGVYAGRPEPTHAHREEF